MHSVLAHSIKTGLEEMGDSGRAETEQALYGYTSRENEREQDRPAYHYATTRSFGRRKKKKEKKILLQFTLWCHQHITFSQRREKPNQKQTEAAKDQGEGEGKE